MFFSLQRNFLFSPKNQICLICRMKLCLIIVCIHPSKSYIFAYRRIRLSYILFMLLTYICMIYSSKAYIYLFCITVYFSISLNCFVYFSISLNCLSIFLRLRKSHYTQGWQWRWGIDRRFGGKIWQDPNQGVIFQKTGTNTQNRKKSRRGGAVGEKLKYHVWRGYFGGFQINFLAGKLEGHYS